MRLTAVVGDVDHGCEVRSWSRKSLRRELARGGSGRRASVETTSEEEKDAGGLRRILNGVRAALAPLDRAGESAYRPMGTRSFIYRPRRPTLLGSHVSRDGGPGTRARDPRRRALCLLCERVLLRCGAQPNAAGMRRELMPTHLRLDRRHPIGQTNSQNGRPSRAGLFRPSPRPRASSLNSCTSTLPRMSPCG